MKAWHGQRCGTHKSKFENNAWPMSASDRITDSCKASHGAVAMA
jgi:hypothetical protein